MPELIADLPAVAILLPAASVYFLWALFHWIFSPAEDEYLEEPADEAGYSLDNSNTEESNASDVSSAQRTSAGPSLQASSADAGAQSTIATAFSAGDDGQSAPAHGSIASRLLQTSSKTTSPQADDTRREFNTTVPLTTDRTAKGAQVTLSDTGNLSREHTGPENTAAQPYGFDAVSSETDQAETDQAKSSQDSCGKTSQSLPELTEITRQASRPEAHETSGNNTDTNKNAALALKSINADSTNTLNQPFAKADHTTDGTVADNQSADPVASNNTPDKATGAMAAFSRNANDQNDATDNLTAFDNHSNSKQKDTDSSTDKQSDALDQQTPGPTQQQTSGLNSKATGNDKTVSTEGPLPDRTITDAPDYASQSTDKSGNSAGATNTDIDRTLESNSQNTRQQVEPVPPDSAIDSSDGKPASYLNQLTKNSDRNTAAPDTTQQHQSPLQHKTGQHKNNTSDALTNAAALSTAGSSKTTIGKPAANKPGDSEKSHQSLAARLMTGVSGKFRGGSHQYTADSAPEGSHTGAASEQRGVKQSGNQPEGVAENTEHTDTSASNNAATDTGKETAVTNGQSASGNNNTHQPIAANRSETPESPTLLDKHSSTRAAADAESTKPADNKNALLADKSDHDANDHLTSSPPVATSNQTDTAAESGNTSAESTGSSSSVQTPSLLTSVAGNPQQSDSHQTQDSALVVNKSSDDDSKSSSDAKSGSNPDSNSGNDSGNGSGIDSGSDFGSIAEKDKQTPASLTHIRPGHKKGTSVPAADKDRQTPAGQSGNSDKYRTAARRKSLSPVEEVKLQFKTADDSSWQSTTQPAAMQADTAAQEEKLRAKDAEIERLKKQLEAIEANRQSALSDETATQDNPSYKARFEEAMIELEGSERRITRLQAAVNNLQLAGSAANTQSIPHTEKGNSQRASLLSKVRVVSRAQV